MESEIALTALSEISVITLYPTGFFLVVFCSLVFFWILSFFSGLDHNFGIDLGTDLGSDGFFPNTIVSLGFSKVPLSIGLTFVSFYGIVISGVLQLHLLSMFFSFDSAFSAFNPIYLGVSSIVFVFSLAASLWLGGLTVRPLAKYFDNSEAQKDIDYIGKEGKVKTKTITPTFGEVSVFVEHSEFLIKVYSEENENIAYNDVVNIIYYNESINKYLVTKKL